ncbi:LysM peptidoglycan-binding domain-containing protein [Sulfitobacter sp. F26204]|uniref:LysM peptidoglycan-binding domain-containing protein n=1 Tax=Sulfitobacter sp. F26204 TaxID=2996014 RepID=UPI00225E3C3B|nr:LysM peptidoglycan-binding domain-containing protein [Sulfitobacter sp. F26204]MCX7560804.1 LysM peptidoglycan-binding domain-containing protein [Sulfitobacter sp. F26204]
MLLTVGSGAFAIGIALAVGYVKWDSQQQQLALMTQLVEGMAQRPVSQPRENDTVTRDQKADLLELRPSPPAQTDPIGQTALVPVPIPKFPATAGRSTVDKLRALVSARPGAVPAPVPAVMAGKDKTAVATLNRLKTFAAIQEAVQELADLVVAGTYDIRTNNKDSTLPGRIRLTFVGRENDQIELERLLSSAAGEGIVTHSKAVVNADGTVNGNILLFDLLERVMLDGNDKEKAAAARFKRETVAMLAQGISGTPAATTLGARFYTVESGDSLAYIALQFYGNTNGYTRIFEANRSKLQSPDKIQVGQRLVIPKA